MISARMRLTESRGFRVLCVLFFICTLFFLFARPCSAVTEDGRIVVVLDPGHSEGDSGGSFSGTYHESWYNWRVAVACKAALEQHGGFVVYLTHETNAQAATMEERAALADSVNADLFLSIHFDGSDLKGLHGTEAMVSVFPKYAKYAEPFAEKCLSNLWVWCGVPTRGIFYRYDTGDGKHVYYWDEEYQWDVPDTRTVSGLSDYYGVVTWGAKLGYTALILEHGYLSNAGDLKMADNPEILALMGRADAASVIEFFGHEHVWTSERELDYASNCCMNGKASFRCTVCGARKDTVTLAAAPNRHFWYRTEYEAPTCLEGGHSVYRCRIEDNLKEKEWPGMEIGDRSFYVEEPPLGHDYQVTEDVPVTHSQDGVHTEVCSRCGDTVTVTEPAVGHRYVLTETKEATCDQNGYMNYTCSVCGDVQVIPLLAPGHSYELTEDVEATCTEVGRKVWICSVCGHRKVKEYMALGHELTLTGEAAPTCTEDGYRTSECSVCGETVTEILEAFGHSFWESERVEPTCTEDGWIRSVCENCGEEQTVILPATGHTFAQAAYEAPTCTREGSEAFRCSACGEEQILSIPMADHSFGDGHVCAACGALDGTRKSQLAVIGGILGAGVLLILLFGIVRSRKKQASGPVPEEVPADEDGAIEGELDRMLADPPTETEAEPPAETDSPAETESTAEAESPAEAEDS